MRRISSPPSHTWMGHPIRYNVSSRWLGGRCVDGPGGGETAFSSNAKGFGEQPDRHGLSSAVEVRHDGREEIMPLIGMAGSSVMLLSATEALKLAIDHGFEAFELLGEFPQCVCDQIGRETRREMRRMVQDSGIRVAVHAPFTSLNIAAFNPGIRRQSIKQISDALDLCDDIGGRVLVVHNGDYVIPPEIKQQIPDATRYQWELNVQAITEIAEHAAQRAVTLCLENTGFEAQSIDDGAEDLLAIRAAVDLPALMFCIDVGHARLNHELDTIVEKLGPWTRHVHLADNLGGKDDHLVIGEGNLPYDGLIGFLRDFGHIVTLEVQHIGKDPEPAIRSRAYVQKMLGFE
jgi:sugar phosphate isomerase/epimerase